MITTKCTYVFGDIRQAIMVWMIFYCILLLTDNARSARDYFNSSQSNNRNLNINWTEATKKNDETVNKDATENMNDTTEIFNNNTEATSEINETLDETKVDNCSDCNINQNDRNMFNFTFYFSMTAMERLNVAQVELLESTAKNGYNALAWGDPYEARLDFVKVGSQVEFMMGRRRLGAGTISGSMTIAASCRRCHPDHIFRDCVKCGGKHTRHLRSLNSRRLEPVTLENFENALGAILVNVGIPEAQTLTLSRTKPNSCKGLKPGDVAVVGLNSRGEGGDTSSLALTALTDLPQGTLIFVTDKEWRGSAKGFVNHDDDGQVAFFAPLGGMPAGTVITYPFDTDVTFNIIGNEDIDLDTGGDSLNLYCYNTGAVTDVNDITFLFSLDYHREGRLYTGSSREPLEEPNDYMLNLGIPGNLDSNFRFSGNRRANRTELLLQLRDPALWERASSNHPFDFRADDPFVIF